MRAEIRLSAEEIAGLVSKLRRLLDWDGPQPELPAEEMLVYIPKDWRRRVSRGWRARILFPIERPVISRGFDFMYGTPVRELKREIPLILERRDLNLTALKIVLENGVYRPNRSYPRLMKAWGCRVLHEYMDLDRLVSILLDRRRGEYFLMRIQRPHLLEWVEEAGGRRLRRGFRTVKFRTWGVASLDR